MGNFRDLKVWQKARDLAVYVYRVTDKDIFSKDFGLKDQIRRAAVSVPSNIAEGDEMDSNKNTIKYLYIAKGSTAEFLTQTIIARQIGYLNEEEFCYMEDEINAVSKMLTRLIQARRKAPNLKP